MTDRLSPEATATEVIDHCTVWHSKGHHSPDCAATVEKWSACAGCIKDVIVQERAVSERFRQLLRRLQDRNGCVEGCDAPNGGDEHSALCVEVHEALGDLVCGGKEETP